MRIWHLTLMIGISAVILALARDLMGRVVLVMVLGGLGMVGVTATAAMCLFQSVGAFGDARDLIGQARAFGATILVLLATALGTIGVIFLGGTLLQAVIE